MALRKGEWLVLGGSALIAGVAVFVGVLIYQQPPRIHYIYGDDANRRGEAVYHREGCNACHKLLGNGYGYGPGLDGVGSRRSKAWLRRYVAAPWPGVSKKRYRTEMPAYGALPEEELDALVGYLAAMRETGPNGEVLSPEPGG
ncbi:MAG TPA: cytochrome c [Gammaproteobacteria bacterium]|nr:cytochrome c [Gammaproteobacteria bacterium]